MNKRPLILATLLFSICLLIFACRRDLNNFIHDSAVPSDLLESAKIYHTRTSGPFVIDGKEYTLRPLWKDSWTVNDNGQRILVVPTLEQRFENKKISMRRFYIFHNNSGNVNGKIVEFMGNDYNVNDHLNDLVKNYKSKSIPGFNGSIFQYNMKYVATTSAMYARGVKSDGVPQIFYWKGLKSQMDVLGINNSGRGKLAASHGDAGIKTMRSGNEKMDIYCTNCPPSLDPTCDHWFTTTTITWPDGYTQTNATYMGPINCTNTSTSGGGSGSGSGSGSGTCSDGTCSGSGSGYWWENIPPYGGIMLAEVVINVQDPCLKANVIAAKNAKNTIRNMLNGIYDNAFDNVRIIFDQTENMVPATDVAQITSNFDDGILTHTITLNRPGLANRSNEYVVSSIYHEIIHAYIESKWTKVGDAYNPPNKHQEMADAYIGLMYGGLKLAFPSISTEDAWALTWEGLKATTMWGTSGVTTLTTAERNDINSRILSHQKNPPNSLTSKGTYCN